MPVTPETYEDLRPLAFAIAYRMLGTVSEAEDVVQEALLRLHRAGDAVASPRAFLATATTRLSIDHLRSARVRRERYPGPWLPEPLPTESEPDTDPETISLALLVVLESLSPVERAVFLLHDVFDYGYDEIAEIVGKTPANCRQLAVRARRHVEARRPRFDASAVQRQELARRFLAACTDGDLDALIELLAEDAVLYGDGGGRAPAAARPIEGGERVARFLVRLAQLGRRIGAQLRPAEVNGQPAALVLDAEGRVLSVLALTLTGGAVASVHSIVNPDKLGHLGPVGDLRRLLREAR